MVSQSKADAGSIIGETNPCRQRATWYQDGKIRSWSFGVTRGDDSSRAGRGTAAGACGPDSSSVKVNRVLITLGDDKQLVYYWFQQRGRSLTNEYLVKWYIFWDSLTRNRTDGALVRLVTPIPDSGDIAEADERMQQFVRKIDPMLAYYSPRDLEG